MRRNDRSDGLRPISDLFEEIAEVVKRGPPYSEQDEEYLYCVFGKQLAEPESSIEADFGYHLHKWAKRRGLTAQHWATTPHGNLRFDFRAEADGRRIVFECDGREYHHRIRDEWRDAIVLGYDLADVVYRIPGSSIWHGCEFCLYAMSVMDPQVFTDIGRQALQKITEPIRGIPKDKTTERIHLEIPDESEHDGRDGVYLDITRRTREMLALDTPPLWVVRYEFATLHKGKRIDELMELWKHEFRDFFKNQVVP